MPVDRSDVDPAAHAAPEHLEVLGPVVHQHGDVVADAQPVPVEEMRDLKAASFQLGVRRHRAVPGAHNCSLVGHLRGQLTEVHRAIFAGRSASRHDGPVIRPLAGLRVVEVSSFVAAPTAGLTMRQLGAEVIRIDPVGGAADTSRWPLSDEGESLYWAALNRGKRSVELDLASPEGQAAIVELVCAPGDGNGILVSNLFGKSWLSDEALRARRSDLIHVQVLGRSDGGPAVDYVVNAATGWPLAPGPERLNEPVNHVLPAWDLLCGMHAATAVLAALHRRREQGVGAHITVSLEDVATSTLTTLGMLTEAHQTEVARPRVGNAVYGSFGADFALADGAVVMVAAITNRQWRETVAGAGRRETA